MTWKTFININGWSCQNVTLINLTESLPLTIEIPFSWNNMNQKLQFYFVNFIRSHGLPPECNKYYILDRSSLNFHERIPLNLFAGLGYKLEWCVQMLNKESIDQEIPNGISIIFNGGYLSLFGIMFWSLTPKSNAKQLSDSVQRCDFHIITYALHCPVMMIISVDCWVPFYVQCTMFIGIHCVYCLHQMFMFTSSCNVCFDGNWIVPTTTTMNFAQRKPNTIDFQFLKDVRNSIDRCYERDLLRTRFQSIYKR